MRGRDIRDCVVDLGYYHHIAAPWLLNMKARLFLDYYDGFLDRAKAERERMERNRKKK